ncbi:hypothetical protein DFH09DRAFT_1361534 [Mycena vulgaris]|nr:hypothetical protein DFH09DRAFT_1361534 [Mycena vulgaris]
MAELDSIFIAIVHHSVSSKKLRLDVSSAMISDETWTETLASSNLAQLEQLRVLGNWVLYSSFVRHVLPAIPSHPQAFFEIVHRCILHLNVYTQFFIKTGIYAADEDPFVVAEDEVAGDAFILLCAMLIRTNGLDWFLSWFLNHFKPLFVVVEEAYTTYMEHGSKFLVEKNRHCFPRPVAVCTRKKISPDGPPEGPLILKSIALLRVLRTRLTPQLPCTPPVPQAIQPKPPSLPSPTLFASFSTLEKEQILRTELVSRRHGIDRSRHTAICKQARSNSCIRQSKSYPLAVSRPLSDVANLPLRMQR